jgi:hypothetical protein
MPAVKKDPSTRARRNTASTKATLPADPPSQARRELPARPDGKDWHPEVLAFWADVWSSPMAGEYVNVDFHQLLMVAYLTHDFWSATTAGGRREAAVELRLQRQAFGLDPYARRRLEWSIETTEDIKDRGRRRREQQSGTGRPGGPSDPRAGLRAVP